MKVVITLGPTQEPIDDVRYITNASSGKMGAALAREAILRGYETTVVAGPVNLELPKEAKIVRVRTAAEMIEKSLDELKVGCDIFISAAAIADYSPKKERGKIKSYASGLTLKLRQNPKLTRLAKEKFPGTFVVAFKAEHCRTEEELLSAAEKKLSGEGLDLVVANNIAKVGFGGDETEVWVVSKEKKNVYIPVGTKDKTASRIWDAIEENG